MKKPKIKRGAGKELVDKISSGAVKLQDISTKHVNMYFQSRLVNLKASKRFVAGWILFVMSLVIATGIYGFYVKRQSTVPTGVDGGVYREGIIGEIRTLNPIFDRSPLENTVSKLIFNGLVDHDQDGKVINDLASSIVVSSNGKRYVVTLRDDVKWHDGRNLSVRDVIFTYKTIQNAESKSSYYDDWKDITIRAGSKKNQVVFELPYPLSSFEHSLEVPILPSHILSEVKSVNLRASSFSNSPIGTGPFEFAALRDISGHQELELGANQQYFKSAPRLDKFVSVAYQNEDDMVRDLESKELSAAVDVSGSYMQNLRDNKSMTLLKIPLNSGVFAFMNTESSILSDVKVRRALTLSVDRLSIARLNGNEDTVLSTLLLPTQLGYDSKYSQGFNFSQAASRLDQAGWKLNKKTGIREKNGKQLKLSLATTDTQQYSSLSNLLQDDWLKYLGVKLNVELLSGVEAQQGVLSSKSYDILVYGISLGYDPDAFVYWHSSQAGDVGLNFSNWDSPRADLALEFGRTSMDDSTRIARYGILQDEWKNEAPAVAIYQPELMYVHNMNVRGPESFVSNDGSSRLNNVQDWTVNVQRRDRIQ